MNTNRLLPFGELLMRHRLSAGLSQGELAGRAGVSPRTVSDLERGEHTKPRPATVRLLADALGIAEGERALFLAAAQGARARPESDSPRSSPMPAPLPASMQREGPPGIANQASSAARAGATAAPPAPDAGGRMAQPQLPSGTVTFLFTDIEGSTRLQQRVGPGYAAVRDQHHHTLRSAITAHGGVEVDTQGDAFFVAFPTAPAALAAAVDATRALAEAAWPEGVPAGGVRVRMGLHTGAPLLTPAGYVGLDVVRAARIAAAGHGGQILLSEATRALVEDALPEGASLRDLGTYLLKDLLRPERLSQLVLSGLPADFPPLKTLDAHPNNLPIQPTALLGREEQMKALGALLRRGNARLVTITGPGGIGKTRLAIQVAAELVDAFPDGVWYVRLSRLSDPNLVAPTIARTLGLKEAGNQPLADILRAYLADRRLLLVLDNFEQVVEAAGEVAALLAICPGVRVLVTSRTPLRLRGEREVALGPLPLPPLPAPGQPLEPERLTQYAAVALFVERAQAARADFAVTAANAPAIAEICARLDGLPLAIELAAARVRLLPPEALLARLAQGLQLLSGGARDLDERQQTMRAAIAWSENLLTPDERVLFRRLAVFVGGCTLEAAEAVCAAPDEAEPDQTGPDEVAPLALDLFDGLAALVEQSLAQQRVEGGEPRFGMLQVIREYALERQVVSGETEALRRAHAAVFLALAERAETELLGPEQGVWLERLEREHDNLRAALTWAQVGAAETGLRLVGALTRFWLSRGHLREGREWVERLLARDGAATVETGEPAPARVRALLVGGTLALYQGDAAAAEPWLEQAAALALAEGDRRTAARALNNLGVLANQQGDWERAAVSFAEGLALWRRLGDQRGAASALNNLGDLTARQGDLERAAAVFAESLALNRQVGDRGGVAVCLNNLGWVARLRGALAEAEALHREALALSQELGDARRCAAGLEHLANCAGAAGQEERAARLLGAGAAVRETLGAPQPPEEQADTEAAVAPARAALGEEAWTAAFAAGRALTLEQAIAEALDEGREVGNG
jgi:predicted ATPase/class 3 adenylate cyclase/transcriptional regulator with XRE-family HTH domain